MKSFYYLPYRVLSFYEGKVNTWDFNNLIEAEKIYNQQTVFEKCCLLELSLVNVKLLKEKKI